MSMDMTTVYNQQYLYSNNCLLHSRMCGIWMLRFHLTNENPVCCLAILFACEKNDKNNFNYQLIWHYSLLSILWFFVAFSLDYFCVFISLSIYPVCSALHHPQSLPSFLIFSWLLSFPLLPQFLILFPASSLSAPSVHGHMLLCRWVPVSGWLPLVTVCFASHGLIQSSEGTVMWLELWCSSLPDAEIQWVWTNDSRQQSTVGRASLSKQSEIAKVWPKVEGKERGIWRNRGKNALKLNANENEINLKKVEMMYSGNGGMAIKKTW